MEKEKKSNHISYRSIPKTNRFWLHSESCYTNEELALREWILKTRMSSGIHQDYLANPSSWFTENSQALINVYEHSWFFSSAYSPRHSLNRDDFHVHPVDSQRLQWSDLYDLMQNVGDYLILRNQLLDATHLNQPMNYVLLDINFMLKGLSQNTQINQVKEQLELMTRYIRSIEKHISPLVGSDRLFLANFRLIIDNTIHPKFSHLIEAQLLRERLSELAKLIKQLSTERNRILHFALNVKHVNPHAYDFSIAKPQDTSAYPTQAAKECGHTSKELSTQSSDTLYLTLEQLKDCPHFQLITQEDHIIKDYAKAISDLNELNRF
ncbi:MAG: hypothetical protein PSV35_10895, partial [bacterium]|nr:hypothetical protein [bacterium]